MEKAEAQDPGNTEQSFLATLSDPQVTLLSVHKRLSLRRSPGASCSARPVSSEEKGSPPSEEGGFPQRAMDGTREISSHQVSGVVEGLGSHEGLGTRLQMVASPYVMCGGSGAGSLECGESTGIAPGRSQGVSFYGR